MTYNAADRKDVRRAEKAARIAERDRGKVLRGIMSTTNGREFIWNRLEAAHVFTISPPTDALAMAFQQGERNQGLQLLSDIMRWCPDEFIESMREANGRRTADTGSDSDDAGIAAADDDTDSVPDAA